MDTTHAVNPSKIVLVPTDFSDSAELAFDQAIEMARATKARIVLLYSCPLPYVTPFDGAIVPNGDIIQAMEDAGRKGLAESIAKRKESGIEISSLSKMGDPRSVILDVAKEISADLIVMGTHGRRGLARLFLGSTAEAIVRTSPIPVLTVRAPVERATSSTATTESTKQV